MLEVPILNSTVPGGPNQMARDRTNPIPRARWLAIRSLEYHLKQLIVTEK